MCPNHHFISRKIHTHTFKHLPFTEYLLHLLNDSLPNPFVRGTKRAGDTQHNDTDSHYTQGLKSQTFQRGSKEVQGALEA